MDEDGGINSKIKTIIIVVGIVLAIVVFFATWWVISSADPEEREHKLEFYLRDENAGPSHIYFIEWENQTYGFEGDKDRHTFNITLDQTYSFEFHLKDLISGELFDLRATVRFSEENGILIDVTENALGNYTIYKGADPDEENELSIIFLDHEKEVYLAVNEYSVAA